MVEVIRWTCFVMVIGLAVVVSSITIASAQDLACLIVIDKPSDGETVYSKMISVSGTAEAMEGYIDSVTVNGLPAGIDTWSKDIQIGEDSNPITVVATTDMGLSCSKTITVYYQAPTQPPSDHEPPPATPAPTVSIFITSIPSGAKVWLDDFYKGITPIRENVTEGPHKIEVTKEGYEIYSETKEIRLGDGEPEELIIELEPLTRSINVFSTPSGANVRLDNVDKRATNCTLSEVLVGLHTITFIKSGYFDETINVSVPVDGPCDIYVTLRRCCYINISSDPEGAKVYLDGKYKGTTPTNISKVTMGNHTIKLIKSGYDNEERKVDVSDAKTYPVHVNLRGYGYIKIFSDPKGAAVYIDGEFTGEETPTTIRKVVGNYSIRLKKWDFKDAMTNKPVYAGNTIDVPLVLPPTLWKRINGPVALLFSVLIALLEFIYIISERKRRIE